MSFSKLDDLFELATRNGTKKLVAVCPYESDAIEALVEGHSRGIVEAVLVGDEGHIRSGAEKCGASLEGLTILPVADEYQAVEQGVRLVSSGQAHLLIKGMVKTSTLLKGVLDKEWGLRSGSQLSHLAIVEVPAIGRPIGVTDGGMNMYPDLLTKQAIIKNAVACYHKLGVAQPKVACLAAVEAVNPDMNATLDAAALTVMNQRGQISGCVVDGPLALDNAISAEAAAIKGIDSSVAGQADILLVPTIEAGNFVGKVAMFMTKAPCAGVILGARAPVVLTSRFDTMESKLYSMALGAALS